MKWFKGVAVLSALLALSILLMTGCAKQKENLEKIEILVGENNALQSKAGQLEQQVAQLTEQLNAPVEPVLFNYAIGINCSLSSGEAQQAAEIPFLEKIPVTATAQIPEHMVLDHWLVNGIEVEGTEPELVIEAEGNSIIEAVLRDKLTVTSINAYIQLLNQNDKPEGDKLTEYVFDYNNAQDSAKVSFQVKAEVPNGYAINYWLINNVPYHFNRTISSITVKGLEESTVYEVVLRKESQDSSEPAQAPDAPAPTSRPTSVD